MDIENISGSDSFHDMDVSYDTTSGEQQYQQQQQQATGGGQANCIDDFMVGDPLEWLMENCQEDDQDAEGNGGNCIVHLLPESSLADHPPLFPDFHDLGKDNQGIQLQPSSSTMSPAPTSQAQQQQNLTSSSSSAQPMNAVSLPDLPNLADPKVTVQALFMDGE